MSTACSEQSRAAAGATARNIHRRLRLGCVARVEDNLVLCTWFLHDGVAPRPDGMATEWVARMCTVNECGDDYASAAGANLLGMPFAGADAHGGARALPALTTPWVCGGTDEPMCVRVMCGGHSAGALVSFSGRLDIVRANMAELMVKLKLSSNAARVALPTFLRSTFVAIDDFREVANGIEAMATCTPWFNERDVPGIIDDLHNT